MRRDVSPLWDEARPRKRFCPRRTRSPHLNLSQPPFEAWCADPVHPHFYSGWQLGDAFVFPPLQLVHSPPANRMLEDTAVSLLQCTEPVPATRQPSTSLSIIPSKDAEGSPSRWRVLLLPGLLDTPISGKSSLTRHSDSSIALPSRMGASTRGIAVGSPHNINCLELRAVFLALKYFLPVLGGYHIIVRTNNMVVVSHINRQGGSRSRTLDRLARHLLLWSQDKFLSLRAVHVPGVLNLAADFLSRQKLKPGEWMLNRQTVSQIWDLFGKAEVDLFASQESTQCPLWFSLSFPTTLGIDAFAHPWPNVSLYAFPPIKLIPAVLYRVKVSDARLLLIAPFWPSQTWFSELTPLLYWPPWEIPLPLLQVRMRSPWGDIGWSPLSCVGPDALGLFAPRQFLLGTCQSSSKD